MRQWGGGSMFWFCQNGVMDNWLKSIANKKNFSKSLHFCSSAESSQMSWIFILIYISSQMKHHLPHSSERRRVCRQNSFDVMSSSLRGGSFFYKFVLQRKDIWEDSAEEQKWRDFEKFFLLATDFSGIHASRWPPVVLCLGSKQVKCSNTPLEERIPMGKPKSK